MSPGTRIAYLHGFNSAPASVKGQLLARAIEALPEEHRPEYFLPRLAHRPSEAIRMVSTWAERAPPGDAGSLTFVGSSLGGYYATWLAERFAARAVIINPAIRPDRDLARYVGWQRNLYTGEEYELHAADIAELARFRVGRLADPGRYFLLVQTGDEILDYREAVRFYAGAWQSVQGGGDHGFQDFPAQISAVLRFAGVGQDTIPAAEAETP
ncbi:MAG TPA: YqiA/YcfP family alpha/beta fold hydrolase [Casimicrobiaceae bacterium]|nr:YqiA/YcfP family alpha/beta fold hydrolase [Casimicrobiaceae bacterium]